ncbi:MAG: phosphopyruvate hydratase [Candidatus Woesearchaeota archaeon]
MGVIKRITAREILDSRGNPTIEATVFTAKNKACASVPSGASKGTHEALELRDSGKRYAGKGVLKAANNVNTIISKKLIGKNPENQELVDNIMIELDGTSNKSNLGANAILAVSIACCRLAAKEKQTPLYQHIASLFGTKKIMLPVPAFNIINGGKHAGNQLDFQEYLLMPVGAKTFNEAMQIGAEVYHELKTLLAERYGRTATNVGDEGGFAPSITCIQEPLDLIADAVQNLGYWKKVAFGIDAAASTFYRNKKYYVEGEELTAPDLMEKYIELIGAYPVLSIEDPFHEDAFEDFAKLTRQAGRRCQIVGDDMLCTSPDRIRNAIVHQSCTALLLKVNQIGTITEAMDAARLAIDNKWKVMVSHRSGETTDHFIADLAVGIAAGQMKSGAPCRGERLAKYNQLLRIEEELGRKAVYAGRVLP